jgi:tight adherence protein B
MMELLISAVVGGVLGLGLLLVIVGLVGFDASRPRRRREQIDAHQSTWLVRIAVGVLAGAIVWFATGWITATLMIGTGVVAAPALSGGRRRRAAQIAKVEALASWAESLRDLLSAAAGVQEAVQASASTKVAAPAIAGPVGRLAARMQHGDPRVALDAFADEVADPVGDLMVAALRMALTRQAGQLSGVLSEAAVSARAAATMRMRVEASRARVHTSMNITVGVTVVVGLGLLLFQRSYLEPFDTFEGQLVFCLIGAVFALGFYGVARLSRATPVPRLVEVGEAGR